MNGPLIEIPTLRATGDVVAVLIETAELAGTPMHIVTARLSLAGAPQRRWYGEPGAALANAAELADRHGLALIDLRDPGDA